VYDSQANFVLVDVAPLKSRDVGEALLKKGIIIRDCKSFRDAGDSLIRVTVGTPEQNEKLVAAFKEVSVL
jgi:histidinol-phosphate aminotransferase